MAYKPVFSRILSGAKRDIANEMTYTSSWEKWAVKKNAGTHQVVVRILR